MHLKRCLKFDHSEGAFYSRLIVVPPNSPGLLLLDKTNARLTLIDPEASASNDSVESFEELRLDSATLGAEPGLSFDSNTRKLIIGTSFGFNAYPVIYRCGSHGKVSFSHITPSLAWSWPLSDGGTQMITAGPDAIVLRRGVIERYRFVNGALPTIVEKLSSEDMVVSDFTICPTTGLMYVLDVQNKMVRVYGSSTWLWLGEEAMDAQPTRCTITGTINGQIYLFVSLGDSGNLWVINCTKWQQQREERSRDVLEPPDTDRHAAAVDDDDGDDDDDDDDDGDGNDDDDGDDDDENVHDTPMRT